MFRHAQPFPTGPKGINGVLPASFNKWLTRASSSSQINSIQAIKAHGTAQITGANKIHLMNAIGTRALKSRVFFPFGFIAACPAICQIKPTENAIDGSQRRQWLDTQIFQFPKDCLGATKQALVVKTQANPFNSLLYVIGKTCRTNLWTPRLFLKPIGFACSIASKPFEKPTCGTLQRGTYRINFFSSKIALNREPSLMLRFF